MKKLKKEQLAYIAGVIDGEGTLLFYPYKRKSDGHTRYYPKICIVNTKKELIDYLVDSTGTGYVVERKGYKANHNKVYAYTLASWPDIEILLNALLPYLVIKKKQALKMLEIKTTFKSGSNQFNKNNKLLKLRDILVGELRVLNKRGAYV